LNKIDVSISGLRAPPWAADCAEFVDAVLKERGITDWEASVLLCDDRFIQDLNERYRGVKAPTDVLAFPQLTPDSPPLRSGKGRRIAAGDIVISLQTLKRQAVENGQPERTELKRLLIHGVLHLQGLDHAEQGEDRLLGIQEEILARLEGRKRR